MIHEMQRTERLTCAHGSHGKKTGSGELHVVGCRGVGKGWYKCCVVLYGMLMWMDVERGRREQGRRETSFVQGGVRERK